jgi:hypothetical protein
LTTPYPAPPVFPDIEAVLVPWLAAQLLAVYGVTARTCTDTPADLASAVPVVAVARSTGANTRGILDRPIVDADCFQATRSAAGLLSRQVDSLMLHYLTGTVYGGAVIGMGNTVKGPGWLAYQDRNVSRSNATYEIFQHAAPA